MHEIREVNENVFEVLEMEDMKKSEIKIGPELNIESVDNIKSHSSLICFQCNEKVFMVKRSFQK